VSIKNKLVTAITTAGLLAGLFGSAFVPVARGAAGTNDDATQTFDATSEYALDTTYAYVLTSVYPTFTVAIDPDDATGDNGTYSVTVAGGTIRSCSGAATSATFGSIVSTTTSCSALITFDDAADSATWTIALNKLAAGATVTVTVADDNSATLTGGLKFRGITASSTTTPDVSSTTSAAAIGANLTANTAGTEWGMVYTAIGDVAVDVENVYGTDLTTSVIQATMTGGLAGKIGVLAVEAADCTGATVFDSSSSLVTDGTSRVCIGRADSLDVETAGTGTLTITASGIVIKTITINVYGDVKSITVTQAMTSKTIAAGDVDSTATLYFAKLTYKDAAGNTLPLTAANLDALDDAVSFETSAGVEIANTRIDAGDAPNFDGGVVASVDGYVSVDATLCTTALQGSFPITLVYENANEDELTANINVVCTSAATKITGIAMEKLLVGPGEKFDVELTAIDDAGKPAGYGATVADAATLVLSPATNTAAGEIRKTDGTQQAVGDFQGSDWVVADGAGAVEVTAPTTKGTYTMVLTYTDIDGTATGSTAGTYTLTVTVRDTNLASKADLTAGPKKKIASADFGPGAAGLKVAFVLENASGVTKTFYRKANASGVAQYTIALRGTWTVYATFGDSITDTVTLKK
jgi:hypothetical protein